MQTFLVTAVFFALVMTAMAVGVIFSNRRLRGSCGGTGEGCGCSPARQRKCAAARDEDA